MKNAFKTVIETKKYDLSQMLKKIDVKWIQGDLTDDERNELILLAQEKANPNNSISSDAVLKEIATLKKNMASLEERLAKLETPEENPETPDEPTEETYPEYVAGKWYYTEDKISFDGKVYECTAPEGQVCTWNPIEYPSYWEEVVEYAE